jgi:hypothetical protein
MPFLSPPEALNPSWFRGIVIRSYAISKSKKLNFKKKHPLGKEKPPGPKGILPLPKYSSKNFS